MNSRVAYWGVQQLTGEESPALPLPKLRTRYRDWFLAPLEE